MSKIFIQFYLMYLCVSGAMMVVYKIIATNFEPNLIYVFCSVATFVVGKIYIKNKASNSET